MAEDELTQNKKQNPNLKFDKDGNDITAQWYEQQLHPLPEGWVKKVDEKGRSAYYNMITGKYAFRRPGGQKPKNSKTTPNKKNSLTATPSDAENDNKNKLLNAKNQRRKPDLPTATAAPSDKFLTIDTENKKLIIKRQFSFLQ